MKSYTVYVGTAEQFAYTFHAKNLKELRKKITDQWPTSYTGRWFKKDASGCPTDAKRWYVNNNSNRPVLVIPNRR